MTFWLVIMIVSFIIGYVLNYYLDEFDHDIVESIKVGFASTVGFTCVVFIVLFIWSMSAPSEKYIVSTKEITALEDSNSISGAFFLGSGYVDGNMEYVYMIKNNGGELMQTIDADQATVYESNSTPRIITYSYKVRNKFLQNHILDVHKIGSDYNIYVPKNSIKRNYNINLK